MNDTRANHRILFRVDQNEHGSGFFLQPVILDAEVAALVMDEIRLISVDDAAQFQLGLECGSTFERLGGFSAVYAEKTHEQEDQKEEGS